MPFDPVKEKFCVSTTLHSSQCPLCAVVEMKVPTEGELKIRSRASRDLPTRSPNQTITFSF